MSYLSFIAATVYYILYPFIVIIQALLTALLFLAAPLIHLSHYIAYACWWPFRFLAKFETLYIFFGVATLIGIFTGTSLHYVSGFIASILKIDTRTEERQAKSLEEYRMERQKKLEKQARSPVLPEVSLSLPQVGGAMKDEYADWLKQDQGLQRKKGVIPSTILEEDDSSDGF